MKFDFDEMTQRRATASLKWDTVEDDRIIPLWVADMDFRTAPPIVDALQKRASTGIFGYVSVPDKYYDAIVNWFGRRHDWEIARESIIYTIGVVPAVSAIIKALTVPGDGVILQTPAYNCFYSAIRNNGCRLIENPMRKIEMGEEFTYLADYDQLEEVASDPRNKIMLLCNPQNPSGRVWSREELERFRDICRRNDVIVVSDEIHCELTHGDIRYTPYASVDRNAIICCSPSKSFNIAGLQNADIIVPDPKERYDIERAVNDNEVCDVNPFGVDGLTAAYDKGEEWLDELKKYLDENYSFLKDFVRKHIPGWRFCHSESTYLAWIDVTSSGLNGDQTASMLLEKAKVRVSAGGIYGDPNCIRINYACPRRRLREALERIKSVYQSE